MGSRLELHEELCAILGMNNVYFNPPASVRMSFPCIVYSKSSPNINRANDKIYKNTNRYEATVIYDDPDSDIPDRLLCHFQMCSIDDYYTADNRNHAKLTIYY